MKPTYLIDSVILIDHLNNIEKATKWLESLKEKEATVSVITRAEVLVGSSSEDRAVIKLLLDQYEYLLLTSQIADEASLLRQKHGWKLPDALQASIALHHGLKLVTRNTKDFNPKKHSFVVMPYSIESAALL